MVVNYANGKIYKLIDNTNDNVYIGSTTKQFLSSRLAEHVNKYKQYLNGMSHFITSFKIIENGDFDIILLENCENCESKNDLHKRERFYIESIHCVNKNIPLRTQKEYYTENIDKFKQLRKQYNIDNHERLSESNKIHCKKYYSENNEQLKQNMKQYYYDHIEQHKENMKQYRLDNSEKLKQSKKQYYFDNKEIIKKKDKLYRETNKEAIRNKKSKVIECPCGKWFTYNHKVRHNKSQLHQNYCQSIEEVKPIKRLMKTTKINNSLC